MSRGASSFRSLVLVALVSLPSFALAKQPDGHPGPAEAGDGAEPRATADGPRRREAGEDDEEEHRRGLERRASPDPGLGANHDDIESILGEGYALVIGIGHYEYGAWSDLAGAVRDAEEVHTILSGLGWDSELLTDEETPVREADVEATLDRFFKRISHLDRARALIWYAGHGTNVKRGGSDRFAMVPSDAPDPSEPSFPHHTITIDSLVERLTLVPERPRQILLVLDSCNSGAVSLTTGYGPNEDVSDVVQEPVRQIITAGASEQEVPDDGTFRDLFLAAITGTESTADSHKDGYLTGVELIQFLRLKTIAEEFTPNEGKIEGLNRGEFVFVLPEPDEPAGQEPCLTLALRSWATIPSALRRLGPYRIEADNECDTAIDLTVALDARGSFLGSWEEEPLSFSVPPGERTSRWVNARFELLNWSTEKSTHLGPVRVSVRNAYETELLQADFDHVLRPSPQDGTDLTVEIRTRRCTPTGSCTDVIETEEAFARELLDVLLALPVSEDDSAETELIPGRRPWAMLAARTEVAAAPEERGVSNADHEEPVATSLRRAAGHFEIGALR